MRLSITPAGRATDSKPNRGITVRAAGGRITRVTVRTAGDPVTGSLNSTGTLWRSAWALDVSQRYTVTATAVAPSGAQVTRTSSFKTFTPKSTSTLTARIVEGAHQTYGVGMPIILYLRAGPVTNKAAVEQALEVKTSRRGGRRLVLGRLDSTALLPAAHATGRRRPP